MLVYKEENQTPHKPPHRIILSDGMTRTDATSFTEEELIDAGYSIAPPKPRIIPGDSEIRWNFETKEWDVVRVRFDNGAYGWYNQNDMCRQEVIRQTKLDRIIAIEKGEDRTPYDEYINELENMNVLCDPELIEWPLLNV